MGFFGNSASLAKIDGDLAAVAEGSADLSYQVGTTGSDAPGRISSNINRFFARVRGLISHARERSVSIAADAARMNYLVQQTDAAVQRQEALAATVFESSNRVNQACCHRLRIQQSRQSGGERRCEEFRCHRGIDQKQSRSGPAFTGSNGNRGLNDALDQCPH